MNNDEQNRFNKLYPQYLNELTLQGKSPKTIEMYSRYIRHIAEHFDSNSRRVVKQREIMYLSST